ncbi:DNA topoisomerase IB [Glaciecola sp. 1036]|uniref:DNA topoisomerase IB n=1 Tax=Alteromonadaceae TaxID=72275 RepID=UPI003D051EBD
MNAKIQSNQEYIISSDFCTGCIVRRSRGKGFSYHYQDGSLITCSELKQRIKKLTIPPAWQNVSICHNKDFKIQARGIDAKNRRQYIYHPNWLLERQKEKFSKLAKFAGRLPKLRRFCVEQMGKDDFSKDSVIAVAIMILNETGIRIGNEKYSKMYRTHGLTTLNTGHIQHDEDSLQLSFTGKHNKPQTFEIYNQNLEEQIDDLLEIPGQRFFRYEQEGQWHKLTHDDINTCIKRIIGDEFSSKFFRTWAASRLAVFFAQQAAEISKTQGNREFIPALVSLVANELNNTPSVCRKYYIHPSVLQKLNDIFESGKTFKRFYKKGLGWESLSACERYTRKLMKD